MLIELLDIFSSVVVETKNQIPVEFGGQNCSLLPVELVIVSKIIVKMAPKEDPETAALRKELDDLIAKFKVWIFSEISKRNSQIYEMKIFLQ